MFKILDGRTDFYQWDLNQKLVVADAAITQVHFCNKTDTCSLVCEVYTAGDQRLVDVPNILLQTAWDIRAYAYQENHTKVEERFKVKARTKPADYVYTETEIKLVAGQKTADGGEIFNDYENNKALNPHAHTEGAYNLALGHGAHIEGYGATTLNGNRASAYDYLLSLGEEPKTITADRLEQLWVTNARHFACAFGDYSHVEGAFNLAIGKRAHAEGSENLAKGIDAHAEGYSTEALGQNSHAEGNNTTATGNGAHAEGYVTIASANYAHAEGNQTQAQGIGSHAEGRKTIASGSSSHAEGVSTQATAEAAHAQGEGSKANHKRATAFGYYTESSAENQCTVGKLNKANANALFIVGNGAWGATKNAFEVLLDGSATVQTQGTAPAAVVRKDYVDGRIKANTDGTLTIILADGKKYKVAATLEQ